MSYMRFWSYFGLRLLRALIALALLYAGILWLAGTTSIEDLILNAVAGGPGWAGARDCANVRAFSFPFCEPFGVVFAHATKTESESQSLPKQGFGCHPPS